MVSFRLNSTIILALNQRRITPLELTFSGFPGKGSPEGVARVPAMAVCAGGVAQPSATAASAVCGRILSLQGWREALPPRAASSAALPQPGKRGAGSVPLEGSGRLRAG